MIRRFDVYTVSLGPTVGGEIRKTRPCVVISPDEMNRHLATLIVAPLTTGGKPYPSRIPCRFAGRDGYIVLDQIRAVRRGRLGKHLGPIAEDEQAAVLAGLAEMLQE